MTNCDSEYAFYVSAGFECVVIELEELLWTDANQGSMHTLQWEKRQTSLLLPKIHLNSKLP